MEFDFAGTQAKVMALFTRSRMLSFLARRGFATTVRKQEVHPAYLKVKETQKKFQVNNGLSIHERGGPMDKVLLYFTYAMVFPVLYWYAEFVYERAFPPKQED